MLIEYTPVWSSRTMVLNGIINHKRKTAKIFSLLSIILFQILGFVFLCANGHLAFFTRKWISNMPYNIVAFGDLFLDKLVRFVYMNKLGNILLVLSDHLSKRSK